MVSRVTSLRVLLLSNYPVPYQLELLDVLGRLERIRPRALFLEHKDPARSWPEGRSPNAAVLPAVGGQILPPELRVHPTLLAEILRERPDVAVVGGYSYLTFQTALVALRRLGVPTLLWSELPRIGTGSWWKRMIRGLLLSRVRNCSAVLAIGKLATEAWRGLVPFDVPVVDFPYVCEIDRYLTLSRPRPSDGSFRLLFSGQMIERKGVDILIKAFSVVARENARFSLALAGDGPALDRYRALVPAELRQRVRFLGFVPWESLPSTYGGADALVVPSRHDGWGLVINEGMAAGLPIVASDAVGAARDLIPAADAGLLVPADDQAALAGALRALPSVGAAMGERARRFAAAQLRPETAAERLERILWAVVEGRPLKSLAT